MKFLRKLFSALVVLGFQILGSVIGGPIGAVIGSMIGAVVARGLDRLIFGAVGSKQESAKVTVRLPEPPRTLAAGRCRIGGSPLFGEFDSAGNFWMLIYHCDSILDDVVTYYFDDIALTTDGSGNVTTNEFCLTPKGNIFRPGDTKVTHFQIWTTTYTEGNPVPPAVTALTSAFPSKWTGEHKLVGTTFSVVKCKAVKQADRYKIYKWRGPFQMGEPALSVVADWSKMYDPRDPTQTLGNRSTYKHSRNAALVWAWWRTHPYGRRKPESAVNWEKVAEQADICDQTVTGIEGSQPRYTCDVVAADDRDRGEVEESILKAFDAQIMFDETGKAWPRAGYYYTPSVSLDRYRDIMSMETMETQNGETDTQGVIVRYTDPDNDWSVQPSAPWINDDHYIEGQPLDYLTVDIPTISNHNQAMRVAKALGKRFQALKKIGPTTGLRSLKALQERIVDISYDNVYSGPYEIIAPIEIDQSGMICSFTAVEVDENRWTLLEGEESSKPNLSSSVGTVDIAIVSLGVAGFEGDKIKVTYTPDGDGAAPDFQYREEGSTDWIPMTVDDDEGVAWSGPITVGLVYEVQYRNVSPGGTVTEWSDPVTVGTTTYTSLPADAATITLTNWEDSINLVTGVVARASTYRWRFYASDGTTLLRTKTTTLPQVSYTNDEAEVDGIARSYVVKVAGVNNIGAGVEASTGVITKSAPAAPSSITATGGDYTAEISFPAVTGVVGYAIHYGLSTGFDPMTEGQVIYNSGALTECIYGLNADTYYVIVAGFDAWTRNPSLLNFTSEDNFVISIGGGASGGDGGGYCVSVDSEILTPNGLVKAGDIEVGDTVFTQHEKTFEWGSHQVTFVEIVDADIYEIPLGSPPLKCTANHLVWSGEGWVTSSSIGEHIGQGQVVKMSVADAKTYISNGVLSHNIKPI